MKKNRKYWLNLTLVLALLVAPLQAVIGAQAMMGQRDCMSMSGMEHHSPTSDRAVSHMKCHSDAANPADRCSSDCSDCFACAGTAAALFSSSPVPVNPDHTFLSFTPEVSRFLYLAFEFRPPRV